MVGNHENVKSVKEIGKNEELGALRRFGLYKQRLRKYVENGRYAEIENADWLSPLTIHSSLFTLHFLFQPVIDHFTRKMAANLAHKRFGWLILLLAESAIG